MTPRELLEQLNQLDEHTRIEAKAAGELGKSVLETVCAFANEPGLGGGWIVLGAKLDEGALFRQYVAAGLPDPDKSSRDLASQCASVFNRPVRIQVESGQVNGKNLLAVFVPEAEPAEKPIYFQNRPLPAGAYRRIGSADVHCTTDDLAVFYQDRRGESFDSTIIRDADLSAFDPAAIAEYRKLRMKPTRLPRNCDGRIKNCSTLSAAFRVKATPSAPPSPACSVLARRRRCAAGFR